jgi:hypothetical protein
MRVQDEIGMRDASVDRGLVANEVILGPEDPAPVASKRRRGVRPKLSGDPQSREIRIEQNHALAVADLPPGSAEVSEVDDRSARFHVPP